jgi:peptidoglycan hydrolase CwlO-like protein
VSLLFVGFGKILDEFEREFQKLREEVKDVKEDINKRQDMLKVIN